MPANRFLLKKESALTNSIYRLFRSKKKELVKLLKARDTQKGFLQDVRDLLTSIDEGIVNLLQPKTRNVMKKGSQVTGKKFNPDFEIDFNLTNTLASNYMKQQETLHLSQAKGSIAVTTHKEIINIIDRGIDEGISYTEVAEEIQKQDPMVFSKGRAKLIAVTELGRAYEFGSFIPMRDLQDKGQTVLKEWITAEDDKVRPDHQANENQGLIPLDQRFNGTGDLFAPAKGSTGFNCRCSTGYEVL